MRRARTFSARGIRSACGASAVTANGEGEVGALGLLIYQAAKTGSVVGLRFALSRKGAKDHIDYKDKNTMKTPLMEAAVHGHLQCVKLLLSHSADIHYCISGPRSRSPGQTATSLATKSGHTKVVKYLQGCIDDLKSDTRTRAHMEAAVTVIADNPQCTSEDGEEFSSLLQRLVDQCGYSLQGEEDEDEPSLIIRAAKADNGIVVYKLVEEFGINPTYFTHPETAENVLHFACRNLSQLRFYFASRFRELLCIPDSEGNSSLHIACENNDLEFVAWLFHGVLGVDDSGWNCGPMPRVSVHSMNPASQGGGDRPRAESHMPQHVLQPASPAGPDSLVRSFSHVHVTQGASELSPPRRESIRSSSEVALCEEDPTDTHCSSKHMNGAVSNGSVGSDAHFHTSEGPGPITFTASAKEFPLPYPPTPLPVSFIVDMKLFRKNTEGESILHMLASHGHSRLLSLILRVAERLKHVMGEDELGVLTRRDGFTMRTPVEEGLMVGNTECVHLLLEFAENANLMHRFFEDDNLLKVALLFDQDGSAKNMEALKMLIGYGFNSGLAKSVTLADLKEQRQVTRLLLFYQTQVVNSLEFATVHPNHTVSLKVGRVKWEGFNLRHIDGEWFHDANCAVDSVSRIFHHPDYKIHKNHRHTQSFFRRLGTSCLSYFSNITVPSSSLQRSYIVPIVEINLTENHLSTVPPELFQQHHLHIIRLSHNELRELPTSGGAHETLYSCPKLHKLELDWNRLQTVPEEFCRGVGKSLEELNLVHNEITELPPGLWVMRQLKKLKLSNNCLSQLHPLSDPRYYIDPLLSQQVVMFFEAGAGGELQVTQSSCDVVGNQEVLHEVKCYLKRLIAFLKTVLVMLDVDDPSLNLAQEVINIHWQRYNSSSIDTPPNGIIDTLLDSAVNSDGTSLIETGFTSLKELHLDQNSFQEVPWDLPCVLPRLHKLYLMENEIASVDIVCGSPSEITTLCLSKNQITTTLKVRSTALPCASPLFLLSTQPDRLAYCTHCQHTCLGTLCKLTLDCNRLVKFDLVNVSSDNCEDENSDYLQMFTTIDIQPLFPRIAFLNLASNQLTCVPRSVEKLTHLSSLNLSGNTAITELPEEMGALNPQVFLTLLLDGVFIKNIPQSILQSNVSVTRNIICYLKSIRENSQVYRRIKLMVVGEANKGKTSLLLSLTKQGNMTRFKEVALDRHQQPLATNGVELGDWEYAPRGKEKVTFMTWDFGGQEEYYATHQCFLTNRSLFLLVWNVTDGEAGLHSLKPWLENIEARARDSPVIVVATHADSLSQTGSYKDHAARLQSRLKELYSRGHDRLAYPRICSAMHVVNCRDSRHMEQLRNYIYNTAVQYCPPPPRNFKQIRPVDSEPLLEQKIPESFVKLQDVVRRLAHTCAQQNRVPIFTRQEYLSKVRESGEINATNDEIDQATSFLHSNGILLHYDDSQLSDLYFVNPQWLCSMLAHVITIRERNPHVKDGIISVSNLHQILHNTTSSVMEVVSLMRKFEVVFQLDDSRLLIPSLLPSNEATPYVIMPQGRSHQDPELGFTELRPDPPAPIITLPDILVRYLLLPYIPNGFFPRLIARVLNSDLAAHVQASLTTGPLDSAHVLNRVHWECWRSGISLIWNHMEIVRIAPLKFPLPNCQRATVISSLPVNEERDVLRGMEIMIAVLPEDKTLSCPVLPPSQTDCKCTKSLCMATWLLQRATELADSVMEDWYEVFGFRRNLNNLLSCMTAPCPHCFKTCYEAGSGARAAGTQEGREPAQSTTDTDRKLYMFSLPFYCLQLKSERQVFCPVHGGLNVAQVAPDLVFADFAPSMLISNSDIKLLQRLGEGGFGTIRIGLLKTTQVKVAVKELRVSKADTAVECHVPELEEETKSWHVYHNGSTEARMMYQLDHPHILTLLGVTLNPIRLVLELARGDLTDVVATYKKKSVRLSRRTLKATLIQIAEAMVYLHSKNILFRDLKPGNVLVWEFPLPLEQWNPDTTVLVKLADYGISKQISPQGIHSKVGTAQYLPPEVLLHSEHEAASLRVDVYSFAMVIYYLFAFKNPFDNSVLVGSQLRSGRRPELLMKQWPHSIQLVELMTWCWSENPTHRPSFDQIHSVLQRETTYSLVGGIAVSRDDEIHAACVRTISIPRKRHSSITYNGMTSTSQGPVQACMRMSTIIPRRSCGIGMETGVEVWYGSVTGKLNVLRYHSTGTSIEPIQHPCDHYISSIIAAGDNVWVASIGAGLWVYDAMSHQLLAVWGETERKRIYQLVQLEHSVLALTNTGIYLFSLALPDESHAVDILVPTHHCHHSGADGTCSVGVYIPQSGDLPHAEVWTCAQNGQWLQVVSPNDLSIKMEVEIPATQGKKIRHLKALTVRGNYCLFMTDRHFLHKFEVRSRRRVGALDCYAACWTNPSSVEPLKQGRVTSLASGDELLYVGNGAGIILIVDADTLGVISQLRAHDTPVRCLFSLHTSEAFSRMFSSVDSASLTRRTSSTSTISASTSFSSIDSATTSVPESPPAVADNRSVLMSFGVGYRGIMGSDTNHAGHLILPSNLTSCPCCTHFFVKTQPSTGYMLFWSRENATSYACCNSRDCREENVNGSFD